jgi:hypothetical protein
MLIEKIDAAFEAGRMLISGRKPAEVIDSIEGATCTTVLGAAMVLSPRMRGLRW